jgi:four helix bundle protein
MSPSENALTAGETKLHHENLDCYQISTRFLAYASSLVANLPWGNYPLADQLKRASLSIPLNIAEGYGKSGVRERARFYDIARGSAHECGAILDSTRVLGLIDQDTHRQGKQMLVRIVSMLVKMIR